MLVCDTNILIAYLNGEQEIVDILSTIKREGGTLFVSAVTVTEVLALPKLSAAEIEVIKELLLEFVMISVDGRLAEKAASLSRQYRLKTPDSIIAASAVLFQLPLASRDTAFKKVDEVELLVF